MKPGDLVKYEDMGSIYYGYVLDVDFDPDDRGWINCKIRWSDGDTTWVYERIPISGMIRVISEI
jgi:hypothetical protein